MEEIKTLEIDLETGSDKDIFKCGVYAYSLSEQFRLLLFGYSVNCGDIHVVDVAGGEEIPDEIIAALTDDNVTKWAFNANFERVCLSRYLHDIGRFDNGDYGKGGDPCGYYLNPAS